MHTRVALVFELMTTQICTRQAVAGTVRARLAPAEGCSGVSGRCVGAARGASHCPGDCCASTGRQRQGQIGPAQRRSFESAGTASSLCMAGHVPDLHKAVRSWEQGKMSAAERWLLLHALSWLHLTCHHSFVEDEDWALLHSL